MKKLILSIFLFVGLVSFPAKVKNLKQNSKKISITTSNKLKGPRYRVEVSVGVVDVRDTDGYKFVSGTISFLPEWKFEANKKIDVTFGPKIITNFGTIINPIKYRPSVFLGGEVNFNYKVKENLKVYTGIELGKGVVFDIKNNNSNNVQIILRSTAKISVGVKIKDRYNLAIYTGNIKGIIGLDVGYTF
ncbi:hypothetical protein [Streptobacillus notomytis]|uniref:hypothetical protein n=1 Tax=Streptobacillus notomytis TaxID=1712031 RepID=UPI0009FB56D9|nr:hypothetical protein [Streptobacillus notomytis]